MTIKEKLAQRLCKAALSHRVGRWHSVVWFLIEGTAIFWPAALLVACLILEFLNP